MTTRSLTRMFSIQKMNHLFRLMGLITGTAVVVLLLQLQKSPVKMFNGDEPSSIRNTSDEVTEKLKNVRILCWVTTTLKNLKPRTQYVKATWGKRCDITLFIWSQEDKNFPVIRVDVPDGRDTLSRKTELALQYVYEHYRDKADWFLKANDDTYVIVDNLKYFLADFKTTDGLYFGFTFKGNTPYGYNSGGGSYVLSLEALKRFYVNGRKHKQCPIKDGVEDVYIGKCMYRLGVENVNTLDSKNRTRFHAFHPLTHMDVSNQYLKARSSYGYKPRAQNISTMPFTFHHLNGKDMRLLEFLIYHIRHVSKEEPCCHKLYLNYCSKLSSPRSRPVPNQHDYHRISRCINRLFGPGKRVLS